MSKLLLITPGHVSPSTDPNSIVNIAAAGLPYSAHATVPDDAASKVIDAAQNKELSLSAGAEDLRTHIVIPVDHPATAVAHTWNNTKKHVVDLGNDVAIPWQEG